MADPRFADFEARITALEIKAGIKKQENPAERAAPKKVATKKETK